MGNRIGSAIHLQSNWTRLGGMARQYVRPSASLTLSQSGRFLPGL